MSDFRTIMNGVDEALFSFFSKACTYTPSGGSGVAVKAIIEKLQDPVPLGPGEVGERRDLALIRTAELTGDPARGDTLSDGTDTWTVVRPIARDAEDLVVTLDLLRT